MKMWMMAAILICGVSLVGCGKSKSKCRMQWRVLRLLRITW